MPWITKKDAVKEAVEIEYLSDTDCDTEELADLPYGLTARRYHRRDLGGGTGTRRGTPMTIKAGGGNSKGKGEGKILNIRLSGDTGAHIPVELNGVSCMSSAQ